MGFWEKLTGRKAEKAPDAPEAEAPQVSVETEASPELAKEAREVQTHLDALEKLVEDPGFEEKLEALDPERKEGLGRRIKDYALLTSAFIMPASSGMAFQQGMEIAAAGGDPRPAKIAWVALMGISAATLRLVWKRMKERA